MGVSSLLRQPLLICLLPLEISVADGFPQRRRDALPRAAPSLREPRRSPAETAPIRRRRRRDKRNSRYVQSVATERQAAGQQKPTDALVLDAMLRLGEPIAVFTVAGEINAWERQDEVATVMGDLAGRGLLEAGDAVGWRLTKAGERSARRARGPYGPYG
jgi:hypothetical protein